MGKELSPQAIQVLEECAVAVQKSIDRAQVNEPHRHRFWEGMAEVQQTIPHLDLSRIPALSPLPELYFPTGSYRKYVLEVVQALIANDDEIPPSLQPFVDEDDGLGLLEFLKALFYNGNGSSQEILAVGMIEGMQMSILPTKGEQERNFDSRSRMAPSFNKADYALEENHFLPGTHLVSVDTMDQVVGYGEALSKAENYLKNWFAYLIANSLVTSEELSEGIRASFKFTHEKVENLTDREQEIRMAFIEWFFKEVIPEGGVLKGITAIVMIDYLGNIVARTQTEEETAITAEGIERAKAHFDFQASGGGSLQYLTKEKVSIKKIGRILGVPHDEIVSLVKDGRTQDPQPLEVLAPAV